MVPAANLNEPAFPYDVFLSHSARDKAVARPLAERLLVAVRKHLKVWFDEWVLKPGDSIPAKIEAGLEPFYFGFRICAARPVGPGVRVRLGAIGGRPVWEAQLALSRHLNRERRFIPQLPDLAGSKRALQPHGCWAITPSCNIESA